MHKITFPLYNLPRRYRVINVLEHGFRHEILVIHMLDELRAHEVILKASLLPLPSGYTCGVLEERRRYSILGGAFFPDIFDQGTIQGREEDHKDSDWWGWFTMEKLKGQTLDQMIALHVDIKVIEDALIGTIKAIHHAYKSAMVLRDLNPRNIFYSPPFGSRLVDLNQSVIQPAVCKMSFLESPDVSLSFPILELKPLPNCTIHDIISMVNSVYGSRLTFLELAEKATHSL
jgi:hypothetical protein